METLSLIPLSRLTDLRRNQNNHYERMMIAMSEERITRRDAIKRAAYTAPVILTILAAPSFASAGSGNPREKKDHKGKKDHKEKRHKHPKFKGND
jgi:hypothetical protein